MQVTINTISDVEQEADIEISNDEIQPHFEHAYEEYRPKVEMKGFRKGRVPLPIIKKVYGPAIEYEALEEIAATFYRKAMDERKIEPVGRPSITDMDFKRGERFTFKIKYEVKPAIELKEYKGLPLVKYLHPVTDQEVDEEVQRLQRVNSSSEQAEKVTDEHFAVTADVQELDDTGSPLIGKKTPGVRFHLIDPEIASQIKDALKAAEVGGTYNARLESQHGDHAHTTPLSLTVTKIEKVSLPTFDDELAKRVTGGKVTSADELRANIRKELEHYWTGLSNRRLDDDLAGELVKQHEFTIPPSIVDSILDTMVEDVKNRARDKRLPHGFNEAKFREENRVYAVWQAKWTLLKDSVAKAESLSVTPEDIDRTAERDAESMRIAKDKLVTHYRTSESAQEHILTEKVMEFLRTHASVTEQADSAMKD